MNKNLIIIPGQEDRDEVEELKERVVLAETALHECRVALVTFGEWFKSKKSRHSSACDLAWKQNSVASASVGFYLSRFGVKK